MNNNVDEELIRSKLLLLQENHKTKFKNGNIFLHTDWGFQKEIVKGSFGFRIDPSLDSEIQKEILLIYQQATPLE